VILVVITVALVAAAAPAASRPSPAKAARGEDTVALSDGRLRKIVAALRRGQPVADAGADAAAGPAARAAPVTVTGKRVLVEVLHRLTNDAARALVEGMGGIVTGTVNGGLV
jgi:hypothetical protein